MIREAKTYKVSIFDEMYSLISDEGHESVSLTAQYVDELMRDIAVKLQSSDYKKIAVLAALKLAHELKTLEGQIAQQKRDESDLIQSLEREISSLL